MLRRCFHIENSPLGRVHEQLRHLEQRLFATSTLNTKTILYNPAEDSDDDDDGDNVCFVDASTSMRSALSRAASSIPLATRTLCSRTATPRKILTMTMLALSVLQASLLSTLGMKDYGLEWSDIVLGARNDYHHGAGDSHPTTVS